VTSGPLEETDILLERAAAGETGAVAELFNSQRDALTRFIAARLDKRMAARLDASDLVQDVLIEAAAKLPDFLADRPIAFRAWLQRLALECLSHSRRTHIWAKKRAVGREVQQSAANVPDVNGIHLSRARSRDKTPSSDVAGRELYAEVGRLMMRLPMGDREVLRLRFVEQLPVAQVATSLGITEGAVRMRQLRALRQLRELLEAGMPEEGMA
jgi:RNA polymerase sigma-70 factor (ECF subfamily)